MNGASAPRYLTWNDAISARFFNAENEGRPLHLYVTEELIDEVGQSIGGGGLTEFIEAVRAGPPGATRPGLCQRALQISEDWRSRGFTYPPYLAYLSLFVLAGGHEGEFDPRSYYPRLWELLGEPGVGAPPSFERMWELWEDLEWWSVDDQRGRLGIFEARAVGGKIHVGLPLAQTVLTEAERRALPYIFLDAGLSVGSLPSSRALRRALTRHGRQLLRRQTLRALESADSSYSDALLDVISDEFADWDGETSNSSSGVEVRGTVSAALLLCLSIDKVSRHARVTLRLRSRRDVPDGGLQLTSPELQSPLSCRAFLPGWSHALAEPEAMTSFEPSARMWQSGLTLVSPDPRWSARLPPASVRLFVDGLSEQLPGLIETRHLSRGTAFYVASAGQVWPQVQRWVETECEGWREIELTTGLPGGWVFGTVREARSDQGLRSVAEDLGFPDRRTLRFAGGVRASVGNTFLSFAPPRIVLDGEAPGDVVTCHGHELLADRFAPTVYVLPPNLPKDVRIGLEVRNGEVVVFRRSLYLVGGFEWHLDAPLTRFDVFGQPLAEGDGIAGALVPDDFEMGIAAFTPDPLRAPELGRGAPRVYFIGRRPGEIAEWPAQPLPDWQPVWAIPFGRRGRAVYCGTSLGESAPIPSAVCSKMLRRVWCRVLWQQRKRIAPPRDASLTGLWKEYESAARDA